MSRALRNSANWTLAVRNHDFAEGAAVLEMAIGFLGLGERERPVDHRAQVVEIARLIASKSARLPTLIAPRAMPPPFSNNGSRPVPDGIWLL
jgi:hypothetical protein